MSNRTITKEEKEYNKLFGANLKHFRKAKRYTQSDIANAIDISFQAVQKYEKGTCSPSPVSLHKMALLNLKKERRKNGYNICCTL